jgi:hypothetical protein
LQSRLIFLSRPSLVAAYVRSTHMRACVLFFLQKPLIVAARRCYATRHPRRTNCPCAGRLHTGSGGSIDICCSLFLQPFNSRSLFFSGVLICMLRRCARKAVSCSSTLLMLSCSTSSSVWSISFQSSRLIILCSLNL